MTAKHDKGRLAEELVVRALLRDGYDVLEQNVRVGRLELDIIARRGEVLAVIEVRTRGSGSWGTALESVTIEKQRRIRRAAEILWARRYSKVAGLERVRFDVVAVDLESPGEPALDYIEAAFV